ncbi:hypothetical protein B0T13DRAFT_220485 [Neurospora crassa]|nr:hypothetical protein B0T13DRAFT_220485 [Neurospora crassa]
MPMPKPMPKPVIECDSKPIKDANFQACVRKDLGSRNSCLRCPGPEIRTTKGLEACPPAFKVGKKDARLEPQPGKGCQKGMARLVFIPREETAEGCWGGLGRERGLTWAWKSTSSLLRTRIWVKSFPECSLVVSLARAVFAASHWSTENTCTNASGP